MIIKQICLKILNDGIRKTSLITRFLFGVRIENNQRIHWDFTTLLLKKCLLENLRAGDEVLEIGTGPHAILSISLAKHKACKITACDLSQKYTISAIKTIELNAMTINVQCSDLFENIINKFDVIFFNSIYIPRHVGKRLGIDKLHETESDWCGGNQGTETIERFLQKASGFLKKNGKILLGFNPKYLGENLVETLCEKYAYTIILRYKKFLNPSMVFVIGKE